MRTLQTSNVPPTAKQIAAMPQKSVGSSAAATVHARVLRQAELDSTPA